MAHQQTVLTWSWPASTDLSARQFRAVTLSSGELAVASSGAHAIGILQDEPDSQGMAGLVMVLGISKAVVDGGSDSVSALSPLKVGTDGKLVLAGTGDDNQVAVSLEDVEVDGVVASVLLTPFVFFRE